MISDPRSIVTLSPEAQKIAGELSRAYEAAWMALQKLPKSREQSLALTNLEQSEMWAAKAVRL